MPKRTRKVCTGVVINLDSKDQVEPSQVESYLQASGANYYVFSLEKGANNGRYHFQCTVQWPKRIEWQTFAEAMARAFKLRSGDAVRLCEADVNLSKYCMKSETHIDGPWCFGTYRGPGRKKKPDHFETLLNQVLATYNGVSWRPFQQFIIDLIATPPDPRHIYWFYDTGNTGKSFLVKYLMCTQGVILGGGNTNDVNHKIRSAVEEGHTVTTVVLDIPKVVTRINYSSLENIKNGIINANKYESRAFVIPVPHVLVFANYVPPADVFTSDRLQVFHTSSKTFVA